MQEKIKKNEGTAGQRGVPLYSAVTEITALGWQACHPGKYQKTSGSVLPPPSDSWIGELPPVPRGGNDNDIQQLGMVPPRATPICGIVKRAYPRLFEPLLLASPTDLLVAVTEGKATSEPIKSGQW